MIIKDLLICTVYKDRLLLKKVSLSICSRIALLLMLLNRLQIGATPNPFTAVGERTNLITASVFSGLVVLFTAGKTMHISNR